MANLANLLATIAANVYTNHNNEVTAQMVKDALGAIVSTMGQGGYIYKGLATTSTNPSSPDANVFYIATAAGTYTNFGGIVVNAGEVAILKGTGTSWSKDVTGAATATKLTELEQQVVDNTSDIADIRQAVNDIQPIVIEGNVTNAPDEEDITTDANNLLKFADRTTLNGMGYKILRRNKTFAEQVTDVDTIYEIRYDFDLNGASVTIPAGCVLRFNGGKLINGTIVGQNTRIDAPVSEIFYGVGISGTYVIPCSYPEWFGADALWEHMSDLETLSNEIRLTAATYTKNNAKTISVNKKLTSSVNTTIVVSLAADIDVALQLGIVTDSPLNRVQGVLLDGINVIVQNTNRLETACLGVGNVGKAIIRQCFFKNENFRQTEFTSAELLSPMDYCNYAIILNGNMDVTTFFDLKTIADVGIYVKSHADFISIFSADLMGDNYSYCGIYGAAFSEFNLYNVAFAKCGIRGIEMGVSGNVYTESLLLDGCRFEQIRTSVDPDLAWRHFKFNVQPDSNANTFSVTCNSCALDEGTILDINVTKGAFVFSFNGGGYVTAWNETDPFSITLGADARLNIKFNGAYWVAHCPNWSFDNNLQYDGIWYKDYGADAKLLDLGNAHIYKNYGGNPSLLGFPISDNLINIKIKNGSSYFDGSKIKPLWWYAGRWYCSDGYLDMARRGATSQRPTATSAGVGYTYFDTDLGKMIVSNGSSWVNMDGTAL